MVVPRSTSRRALRSQSPAVVSPGSLLNELGTGYPDMHGPVIVQALDRAHEAALASGVRVTPAHVMKLARDHLDALRTCPGGLMARSAEHRRPQSAEGPRAYGAGRDAIPCASCRHPMSARSFVHRSTTARSISATCPACQHRTTIWASTWERSEPAITSLSAAGIDLRPASVGGAR
jgi:hypothetical protein